MRIPSLRLAAIAILLASCAGAAEPVPIPIQIDHRGLLTIDGILRADSTGAWGASNLVIRPAGGWAAQDYCLSNIVRAQRTITADFAVKPAIRMVETTAEEKDAQGRKSLRVSYELTPAAGGKASYEQVYVLLPLAATDLAGGTVTLDDGRSIAIPAAFAQEVVVPPGSRSLTLTWGSKRLLVRSDTLRLSLRDLRPKTSAFQVWLEVPVVTDVAAMRLDFTIAAESEPYVVAADGTTWVELPAAKPAAGGGILDFSTLGGPPAGTHGRIIAKDGHFAHERTGERVRLIGANLCYTANYLEQAAADALAARFRAMGYNTVRFHHTDVHIRKGDWKSESSDDIDPDRLDRLDYLFAAMKKAGLFITIDLYTQRRFGKGEIAGIDQSIEGDIKGLVPIHEPAFAAWQKLVVRWMEHVNPYTGLAWKDDPALLSICPLNEDSIASVWAGGPSKPLYLARFAAWKREQGLTSTVEKPGDDPLFARFLIEVKMASNRRIEAFLRGLGVKAMITGSNWWDTMGQTFTRDQFDLVDNHQYSDHPQPHWLPAKYNQQGNLTGHPTYMTPIFMASTRVFGKPFTVSEWNFCAPNRFRAEGGALMGAYAALQDWDGLYRFAWSHDGQRIDGGEGGMQGFDIVGDPLNQLAERQAILLFRRGDVAPARSRFVYGVTMADATRQGVGDMWGKGLFPHPFNALALRSQTGSQVIEGGRAVAGSFAGVVAAAEVAGPALAGNAFRALASLPAADGEIVSDTGEITLDRKRGSLRVAAPRSACIVAPAGLDLAAGGLAIARSDAFCSLSAHAMDGKDLAASGRVLLLHLTDVLNTGMTFATADRTTLLRWGGAPRVVRTAAADVTLQSTVPGMTLFACDHAGNRLKTVPATYADGAYAFRAAITQADPVLVYELAKD